MSFPNVLFGPEGAQYEAPANAIAKPAGLGRTDGGRPGKYPLGTQLVLQDGRKFRFFENGGTTAVIGSVFGSAAILTTDQDMTPAAGAVGDKLITFTHGAATTVQNFFAEGFVFVTITPGFADHYKVNNHLALASAVAGDVVNLDIGMALRRAITTTTRVSLQAHPLSGTVIVAATIAQTPMGIPVVAIAANKFGWLQTAGPCAVLCAGTLTIGSPAVMLLSGGTAGAVAPASAATQPVVGRVLAVEATTQAASILLCLDN